MNDLERQLFRVLASLKNEEEVAAFFEDLCTYNEIEHMAQRVEGATLLLQGCTYQQVAEKVKISSATLSRINRCVQHGDGYHTLLPRFFEETKEKNQ